MFFVLTLLMTLIGCNGSDFKLYLQLTSTRVNTAAIAEALIAGIGSSRVASRQI
mgnify:CR=1 FL=1